MKEAFRNAFFNNVVGDKGSQYFYDIAKSWAVILVASICAIIIAFGYLMLIRFLGGVIIWVSVAFSIAVLVSAGIYSYLYARP